MKKSLILMMFLAFAFVGNAQVHSNAAGKFYVFEYEYNSMSAMRALIPPTSGLEWYQTVNLYIDGGYSSTFNIGNTIKAPLAMGFSVPVGSSWYLETVKTVATINGMVCMPRIYYSNNGTAGDSDRGMIRVTVEY